MSDSDNAEVVATQEAEELSSLSFIEQIRQLPSVSSKEQVDSDEQKTESESRKISQTSQKISAQPEEIDPPEILVAYLSGQPEAVAAIELLREAQRIWDQRKRSITPSVSSSKNQESSLTLDVQKTDDQPVSRRYSHEDLRIAYSNISAQMMAASERKDLAGPLLPAPASSGKTQRQQQQQHQHYRRRPSTQAESLSGQAVARYQQHQQKGAGRNKRNNIGTARLTDESALMVTPKPARTRPNRASVDMVSQAMTTAGMAGPINSSHPRNSSLTDSVKIESAARRPSHQRLHGAYEADVLLPLGTDAASFAREQRRRASSKASAIFLVSPSNKETQLVPEPEDEDDGSPEGRRRRRTISIIATVGAFLLVLSILMVTVTLRLATHIDDLGKPGG